MTPVAFPIGLLAAILLATTACERPFTFDRTDAEIVPAGPGPGGDGGDGGEGTSRLSLVGDPLFDLAALTPQEQLWHTRVVASLAASAITVQTRASSHDLYELGRYVGDYNAALLAALRATGDLTFLDRVAEISEMYRATLADPWADGTTDGYLNWQWLATTGSSDYGKDTHQMDEAMTHGNVALVAYAFHVNRHLGAAYGEKADFWTDYLVNHFIAKWTERAAGDPTAAWEDGTIGFYKRLLHPRANQQRLAYFLWRLTGDDGYGVRAAAIASEIEAHMVPNPEVPEAYRWKHQVSGADEDWQRINYAQYFVRAALELHFEDYDWYADEAEMTRLMTTFRDVVLTAVGAPWSSMSYRVYGSETTAMNVYGLSGLARWDETATILDIADAVYDEGSFGLSNAAYALLAISTRD